LPPPPPTPPATAAVAPTKIAGQESAPVTAVPAAPAGVALSGAKPGSYNTLAVVSFVTAIISPLGHLIGIGGITLIIVSIVCGHMARKEIKTSGEKGDGLALAGMIISYVHAGLTVLGIVLLVGFLFFGLAALIGLSGH